jgi:hypothetical protein
MDGEWWTPGKVLAAVLITLVVVIGGWYAYWSLSKTAADNRYDVNTRTQQYQQGLIDAERDRVSGYDDTTSPAQREAIAKQFCAVYAELTQPPPDLGVAHDRLCNTG